MSPTGGRQPVLIACLLVVLLIAALGACGDEDEGSEARTFDEPAALSKPEARTVRNAQRRVRAYCGAKLRALARGGTLNTQAYTRASAALDRLGELAEAKPEAQLNDGTEVRLALGDIAEDLEGTNCDQGLVEMIEARLAELPEP